VDGQELPRLFTVNGATDPAQVFQQVANLSEYKWIVAMHSMHTTRESYCFGRGFLKLERD